MSKRSGGFIPYGKQSLDASDVRAVTKVLKSDWLTQGPEVQKFEEAFARYCGAPYAVAVSSGTAGLHLACLAAGFSSGDEVITSPLTFVATANSILYSGAKPRFADIGKDLNLDPSEVKKAITRKTRGIISVDFGGQPCVLGPKKKYSKRKDFVVIEDACHALGAEILKNGRWKKAGDGSEADMSVFSFHPVKHITTGEGGMVTTQHKDLYEKLKRLRSHGIERDPKKFIRRRESGNPWYYEMTELGFNYRMTDIQCTLGRSQLKKIEVFLSRRNRIAAFYNKEFKNLPFVITPAVFHGKKSSYHLYVLRISFDQLGISRAECMARLKARGIGTQVHYIPVHRQPYYERRFGYRKGDFPVAERFYEEALSLPIHPSMTYSDAARVTREIIALKEHP